LKQERILLRSIRLHRLKDGELDQSEACTWS